MNWLSQLLLNSVLLGIGLAMDAFSVSLVVGLNEKEMKAKRMLSVSGLFGFCQGIMPLIGWFCVHTLAEKFQAFQRFIPWIALALLLYIGGKMIIEGRNRKTEDDNNPAKEFTIGALVVQGIATSIDALSVGFTIADYSAVMALIAAIIIGIITFIICVGGVVIGKKFGTKLAGKANILGGIILIGIGVEIWVTGVLI